MMKSKKSLMQVALFVFAILIGASCVPKDAGVEEVLLTVSSDKVILEATSIESVAKVDVNTNYTEWETSTNASWLQATRRGDNILLSASANTDDKERNADLMIYAGVKVKKVRVTQAGGGTSSATMSLEVNPLTIEVPKDGKKYLIRVNSNDDKWEVETADENADWVIPRRFPGFIELEVSANNTSAERTTKLFVKLGTDTKEITVSQKMAPSAAKYTLPLFELKMDHRKLLNYEEGTLGNKLLLFTRGRLSIDLTGQVTSVPHTYLFASFANTIEEVTYKYTREEGLLRSITMSSNNYEAFSRDNFMPFLEKSGFEFVKGDEFTWYAYKGIDPTVNIAMEVEIGDEDSPSTYVRFAPVFNQTREMPTYADFPYEAKNELIDKKIKVEALEKEMTSKGWKTILRRKVKDSKHRSYDLEKYGEMIYDLLISAPLSSTGDIVNQQFLFDWRKNTEVDDLGNVWQVKEYRKDVSKVLWKNPYGEWKLTKEFEALLKKEGFEKDTTNKSKSHDYYKEVSVGDKKMKFVLSADCIQADDINNGDDTLLMIYWYRK